MSAVERLEEIEARLTTEAPWTYGELVAIADQDVPALISVIRAVQAALTEAYERIGGCCSGTDGDMCDRCRLYDAIDAALDPS